MKKLKQGQTVYEAYVGFNGSFDNFTIPEVRSYFLYSQKEPLPSQGSIISNMPVDTMRIIVKKYPTIYFTHSRRKAETRVKQMIAML